MFYHDLTLLGAPKPQHHWILLGLVRLVQLRAVKSILTYSNKTNQNPHTAMPSKNGGNLTLGKLSFLQLQ